MALTRQFLKLYLYDEKLQNCKNKDILILNYKQKNDYYEEKKLLKSLGYIK